MSAYVLLDRLAGVRQIKHDAWMAQCPVHEDRRPSLSVRELSNGTVLVHCFAGCATREVVAVVGLEMHDLFSQTRHRPSDPCRARQRWRPSAGDLLSLLHEELCVVVLLVADIVDGKNVTDENWQRLAVAANRLARGCNHAN